MKLWHMYEERCLATFDVAPAVQSIAWSPDGTFFVAGTATGSLQVSRPEQSWTMNGFSI